MYHLHIAVVLQDPGEYFIENLEAFEEGVI